MRKRSTMMRFCDLVDLTEKKFPRIQKFCEFLRDGTDYFIAPASTKYHHCFEGGLVQHSVEVAETALDIRKAMEHDTHFKEVNESELAFCGLFHDVGKGLREYYIKDGSGYRYGQKVKVPHAQLSLYLLTDWFAISWEVRQAILSHNGMFTGTGQEIYQRHNHTVLDLLLHTADMFSLKLDEPKEVKVKKEKKKVVDKEIENKLQGVINWAEEQENFDATFVYSLQEYFEREGRLSQRQLEALDNIIENCNIDMDEWA